MAEPNFQNRTFFHYDNLDVLRNMNSECVDLIATDPPFNKSRDFHSTPNSIASGARFQDRWVWDEDVHEEWVEDLRTRHHAVWEVITMANATWPKKDMGAFLCYMAVRLIAMHRVLKSTGSLYLHCDPTASHYLKALLDAIFGAKNFRNEIVWRRRNYHNTNTKYGSIHDSILFYTKSSNAYINTRVVKHTPDELNKRYKFEDAHGKYYLNSPTAPGAKNESWRGIDPGTEGRHWALPIELPSFFETPANWREMDRMKKLDILFDLDLLVFTERGYTPAIKCYQADLQHKAAQDVVLDVDMLKNSESMGYPTQKPAKLYERFVEASSQPGDVVLDPFSGMGTTLVAAERLGRQWVGVDIWEKAYNILEDRLLDSVNDANVRYIRGVPERTDDGDTAVAYLESKLSFDEVKYGWQQLGANKIVEELRDAQKSSLPGLVICAGCGRELDKEFMELDHINPRASGGDDDISNRILLCRPCNRYKSASLTLHGLMNRNREYKWMVDEKLAKRAQENVREQVKLVKHRLRD